MNTKQVFSTEKHQDLINQTLAELKQADVEYYSYLTEYTTVIVALDNTTVYAK